MILKFNEKQINDFVKLTQNYLLSNEKQNTHIVSRIYYLLKQKDIQESESVLLAVVNSNDEVCGVICFKKDNVALFSDIKNEYFEEIISFLINEKINLTGIISNSDNINEFINIFFEITNVSLKLSLTSNLMVLENVNFPKSVNGLMRYAEEKDRTQLIQYLIETCKETINLILTDKDVLPIVDAGIKYKNCVVMESDGVILSMSFLNSKTFNGAGLSYVHTPLEHRGKGYASNLVAFHCQKLLEHGNKFCFLEADVTNLSSNSLYEKIGFKKIANFQHWKISYES